MPPAIDRATRGRRESAAAGYAQFWQRNRELDAQTVALKAREASLSAERAEFEAERTAFERAKADLARLLPSKD